MRITTLCGYMGAEDASGTR